MQNVSVKFEELKRIVVIGTSCSGKTTFANRLAKVLGTKHIEMDALNWLPEWQQRKTEELRDLVEQETSKDKWVLDGNYSRTRDITWNRATHIVWLNFSFPIVFYRAVKRTIKRAFTGEEICGGNRETFRQSFLSTDSMILWVLRTYYSRRYRYQKQLEQHEDHSLQFLVFQDSDQTDKFFKRVEKEISAR